MLNVLTSIFLLVAAWGILGSLWEVFESATEGLSEAACIRVAYVSQEILSTVVHEPKLTRFSIHNSISISVQAMQFLPRKQPSNPFSCVLIYQLR